ncbi:ATPase family associated with various cellular activities (AAA) [Nitrosomonas ureae]|uniref:ATPase family associated with various cellular activities (AAA) n=1 Tax=Nitrosomonas ureae TaxID=44577 RepID=A0A285BXS8_9PROT|nr:MoxR family ATPase [Nitrosomonas ureae]SNX59643.1 ATPase family associated with various cellular activities (AAA) [Nitrosomonas ureae]
MTIEPPQHPLAKQLYLPTVGTWQESWYWLDGKSQDAIDLAVASGRPLLARGLPGTGKSDLARAAAEYLGRAFVYEVITARTEPQDLLWHFDAIARLADAQARESNANSVSPLDYVSPGPLWWALNWDSAARYLEKHSKAATQSPNPSLILQDGKIKKQSDQASTHGTVLLLDEIDKADSELPNSLLEVLANTGFRLPWEAMEVKSAGGNRPLMIITTNEDRELPPAFVRRCLVLNIVPDTDFAAWIKQRARVHFRDPERDPNDQRPALTQKILDDAATKLMEERDKNRGDGPQPGLAEYLDLLRGLEHLAPNNPQKQSEWLDRVYSFAYHKQPDIAGNNL